jgi:lipoteichoic acid synthase
MLTAQLLNKYIAPFEYRLSGILNAILGNFSILFLIVFIIFLIFKKASNQMIMLIIITFLLNFWIFWMGVFNLFFGTAFSVPAITIFNNPSEGFAIGTFLEAIKQLFTYFRIIVFWPSIILLTFYIFSNRVILKETKYKITIKKTLSGVIVVLITLYLAISTFYRQYQETLPLNSAKSTFALQNLGVYPYYFGALFGQNFDLDLQTYLDLNNSVKLADAYQEYNKNQSSYTNFFDGNTYSNRLTRDQITDNLYINNTLSSNNNLHGILENKNLILIHLESINNYLLELNETSNRLNFLNALLNESFYFENFYNNVGMGVSSDGELAVLTGLYPMGDRTLYWDYNHTKYELDSLIKYFNQKDYLTKVIHGDYEKFYNRVNVYPNMYQFDQFYALEDFVSDGYDINSGYLFNKEENLIHNSPWISDYHLADYTNITAKNLEDSGIKYMLYPIAMMPHTPYEHDPYGYRPNLYPNLFPHINQLTYRYLSYADYIDETIKRFFIDENNENVTVENAVYIFYSDHGTGIKNGDLDILFDKKLEIMETRQILQKVPAWIYVPGSDKVVHNGYEINEGLLKGTQNLVRSQVDLYRTIIELFNLEVNSPYYGVHGLSNEKTFALDNRLLDVATDEYFFSMRNPKKVFPEDNNVDKSLYDYILRFKQLSDILLSRYDAQKDVNQAIKDIYGG